METKDMTQEQISALLDSELGDAHIEGTLASLRRNEGRGTWDVYHQIGDVLRSEEMAQDLSPGFTARLFSRLDEEPPILAPVKQTEPQTTQPQQVGNARLRRFAMPLAIAAAAVFAIVAVPQMSKKAGTEGHDVVDANQHISLPAPGGNVVRTGFEPEQSASAPATATTVADGAVLRDPRLDQYMMDHQRYSPAWNSSAEYARSATYTVTSDGNK